MNKENNNSKSKYVGVFTPGFVKGYQGLLETNGGPYKTAIYDTEEEAALAYDKAVLFFFGNGERTRSSFVFNFPDKLPPLPGTNWGEF